MSFEDELEKKEKTKKRPEKAINSLLTNEEKSSANEEDFLEKFNNKKEKVEDTHSRHTFLVRNDLLKRLNKLAKGRRGFMKEFINHVIETGLDKYENKIK
ncbi:hypothetical protein LF817_19125 [Halobacillus sp. A1]|uniref:hypothetical protein n=1 Tax=Halobacillus sp. A1 TaxID=2880262 RepID=UPI0020A633E7|nr:hypothetical protein [Halobacillus sp. A1]MCP3033441.1 hypothetical protein [Halobacillus sp. A1]